MTVFRRARAMGRRSFLVASAFALVVALSGYFVADALTDSKPAAPTLTGTPTDPTATTTTASVTFTFTDSAGLTFKCALDTAAPAACTSPKSYPALAQGFHTFQVVAYSGTTASNPTTFSWSIVPPKPVIGTHPTDPTAATTATFTYTDAQSGVGLKCALDTAAFTSCASGGVTYSNLAAGAHGFQVEAQVGSNPPSAPARFLWTVDRTAPTIVTTFPVAGRSYNGPGWSAGCSPVGICGTATDPSGVASVAVAIQQQSSGKYWNGSAFSSATQVFNTATGTTAWGYPIVRPTDGVYTAFVRATDSVANTTANGDLNKTTFTIDTVAPAAPTLVEKPTNPTTNVSAEIAFTDTTTPMTFTCRLDAGAATNCTGDRDNDGDTEQGEAQYSGLTVGSHCFTVFATDAAFNVGPTTTYCWTINAIGTGKTITANSGTPQFTTINTNFGAPLVAKVTSSSNNPIPNASVTFTAPASGASGTFASPCSGTTCVVTTNASGLAAAPALHANGTSGSYTVSATAAGAATPANFSLINSANFTISADVTPKLFPGTSQPVNLSITNPNPTAITIAANGVTITVTTTQAGCANSNFPVTHGPAISVTVPGNSTRTLSALAVAPANWPVITMLDTHTNQNACQGAPLTLTYTGSATG